MTHKTTPTRPKYNTNVPPIGSRTPNQSNFLTVKNQPKQILNGQPPRNLKSIKDKQSSKTSGHIVKPFQTPSKISQEKPKSSENNEKEIKNCISKIDEIFESLSDYLLSPEFQDTCGSIPIPSNLISGH